MEMNKRKELTDLVLRTYLELYNSNIAMTKAERDTFSVFMKMKGKYSIFSKSDIIRSIKTVELITFLKSIKTINTDKLINELGS